MLGNLLSPRASQQIHAALGVDASDAEALRRLTFEDVEKRLKAHDLSGLADAVWESIKQLRGSPTPSVRTPALYVGADAPPTPSCATAHRRQPSEPFDRRAQRFVPAVPYTHGRGDNWQYYPGEGCMTGCWHGFGLVIYNLSGMFSKNIQAKA